MHVLYLTDDFPFPLTSGLLRHYYLIRELSSRHSVSLFSRVGPGFESSHTDALKSFTRRIQTFSTSQGGGAARSRLGQLLPFRASEVASGAMGRAIVELFHEDPFQVVVTVKRCAGAVSRSLPVPVVADICDAASMRIRRRLAYAPLVRTPRLLASYLRMRLLEWKTVRRSAHCIFISPRDRRALLGDRVERTSIIPNGVDTGYWKRSAPALGANLIVFTGAMDYPPNVDAALRLIESVFDRVRKVRADAKLCIVGRDPHPAILRAAEGHAGVEVTGFVEDVRPYLDRASVFCAPLRFGAGAQNKILEALAMEVPCVVSPLAAEGLRVKPGVEPPVFAEADEERMAQAIVRCLEQAASGKEAPAGAGRTFVEENFKWQRSGHILSLILEDLASRPNAP